MADIFDPEKRSSIMSLIKGRDTVPELIVRKYLFGRGLRYRIHSPGLPGKPDIVLPKYKAVVFVHGCFWHGHDQSVCKISGIPKSNVQFWSSKISRNIERDAIHTSALEALGWKVLVVWECSLAARKRVSTLENLYGRILGII